MKEYLAPEIEVIENLNTNTMNYEWNESDTDIEVEE